MSDLSARIPADITWVSRLNALPGGVQAATVAAQSVQAFREQFGKLQEMRRDAVQNGEMVTRDSLGLDFEPRGILMMARGGTTVFRSEQPQPNVTEVATQAVLERSGQEPEVRTEQPHAPAAKPAAAPAAAPASAPKPAVHNGPAQTAQRLAPQQVPPHQLDTQA
ncbi:MAG: hypothetical protein HYU66_00845 [Armatimonadetes bacterium]|nr:hypothetical protein [Armatimonadota bacterium]